MSETTLKSRVVQEFWAAIKYSCSLQAKGRFKMPSCPNEFLQDALF